MRMHALRKRHKRMMTHKINRGELMGGPGRLRAREVVGNKEHEKERREKRLKERYNEWRNVDVGLRAAQR